MKIRYLVFIICFLCSLTLSNVTHYLAVISKTENQNAQVSEITLKEEGMIKVLVPFSSTILQPGESLDYIDMVDQAYGWCASKNKLFKTIDGGDSWQEMKLSIPQQAVINNIYLTNRSLGWVVLQKYGDGFDKYEDNYIWILKTIDGGETWNLTYEAKSIDTTHLTFTDESNGWLVGAKYAGYKSSFILNTDNQGKTWNDVSPTYNKSFNKNNGLDIALQVVQNGDEATFVASKGVIIKTSDRGKTWKKIDAIADTDEFFYTGIRNFGVMDDGRRWAMGERAPWHGGIIKIYLQTTRNNWDQSILGITNFSDTKYLFGNTFLVSGSEPRIKDNAIIESGVIRYTSDAGETWITIYQSNETESVNSIDVIDNEVWAACKNGAVVKLNLPSKQSN